jgi:hypothetical protein
MPVLFFIKNLNGSSQKLQGHSKPMAVTPANLFITSFTSYKKQAALFLLAYLPSSPIPIPLLVSRPKLVFSL